MRQQLLSDVTSKDRLKRNAPSVGFILDQQIDKASLHVNESISIFSENYLHRLLSETSMLKSGLTTYLLALILFEDAMESFIQKRFRFFDALIGNNSCYVVSYIIFFLCRKMEYDVEFQKIILNNFQELSRCKLKLINLLKENEFIVKENNTFNDFLVNNNLVINLDLSVMYLSMCFSCSLSKSKNECNYDEIDVNNMLEKYSDRFDFFFTKKPIIKTVKHWQKTISYLNVKILQFHSQFISDEIADWKKYIFNPHVLRDSRGRLCMPSLYSLKVVYHLLLSIPGSILALQVNVICNDVFLGRITLYYEVLKDCCIQSVKIDELNEINPVYIFSGCRYVNQPPNFEEMQTEFSNRKLSDLLFAHEVTYPQYPKSLKKENIVSDNELVLNEISRLKKIQGCSLDNPFDFCTVHVYVDDTVTQALSVYEPPVYLPNLHQ